MFFRDNMFRAHDMIGQDIKTGMSFYIEKDPEQVAMPITNQLLWAYKCRIVGQLSTDMEVGDLMMGKPTFRLTSAVGEFDEMVSSIGPMSEGGNDIP